MKNGASPRKAVAAAPRRRVRKLPDDRRRELIDAAVTVMARRGVEATTIEDITRAARVAKGTFYLYFESKEQLLTTLKRRFFDEVLERLAGLRDELDRLGWVGTAERLVEVSVDLLYEASDTLRVIVLAGFDSDHDDGERQLVELFAAAIREGVELGEFDVEDPHATALLLHHAVSSAVIHALMLGEEVGRERVVAAAQALVRRMLTGRP